MFRRNRGFYAAVGVAVLAYAGVLGTATAGVASAAAKKCTATVGFEAPITGQVAQLGGLQLAAAKAAAATDNKANKTSITLKEGDTQLMPAQATTVTQQFISNSKLVAVVGPAGSQEVTAVGSLMARAGLPFISGSATNSTLTGGKYPTFFRVVSKDSVQGPQDANYILKHLHPKAIMLVDDQSVYSTGLAGVMIPIFQKAGLKVDHESVSQSVTDFSSIVSKVTPGSVVVLPWQVAANAQQFGLDLASQHKSAVIFGTDGTDSPQFTIPGSYVSNFAPDISTNSKLKSIVSSIKKQGTYGPFGVPSYAAVNVAYQAIASVCKSGKTPSRSNVLAAIKKTNEPTSALGQSVKFTSHGDLVGGKFFLFHINSKKAYVQIPTT